MTSHNTTRVACADDSIRIAARALADAGNALQAALREVRAASALICQPEAAIAMLLTADKLVGPIESMVQQIPRLALTPTPAEPAVQLRSSPQIIAPIDLIWTRGESGSYVAEAFGCKYSVSENGNEPSTSSIKWVAEASDTTNGVRWLSDGEPRCRDAKALCVAHANARHQANVTNSKPTRALPCACHGCPHPAVSGRILCQQHSDLADKRDMDRNTPTGALS